MDNELSQLDALIESDVLDALGKNTEKISDADIDSEEILIEDLHNDSKQLDSESKEEEITQEELSTVETELDTQSEPLEEDIPLLEKPSLEETPVEDSIQLDKELNTSSLSKLLSELLNNKTIEITIKIKD